MYDYIILEKLRAYCSNIYTLWKLSFAGRRWAKASNKFQIMTLFSINVLTNQYYHHFQLSTSLDYYAQRFLGWKKMKKGLMKGGCCIILEFCFFNHKIFYIFHHPIAQRCKITILFLLGFSKFLLRLVWRWNTQNQCKLGLTLRFQ